MVVLCTPGAPKPARLAPIDEDSMHVRVHELPMMPLWWVCLTALCGSLGRNFRPQVSHPRLGMQDIYEPLDLTLDLT